MGRLASPFLLDPRSFPAWKKSLEQDMKARYAHVVQGHPVQIVYFQLNNQDFKIG